jgi:hypothetical protein
MTGQPEIRAVLDRSALLSYARGHVHVGEVVREVADEENVFVAIPVLALLQAHADSLDTPQAGALLRVITTLPGIKVMEVDAAVADRMAGVVVVTNGDLSGAHAVWTANSNHALLMTTKPDDVKTLVPEANIIPISAEDA